MSILVGLIEVSTMAETSSAKVQKFFEDLESHKAILTTCTNLFAALSHRFTSLDTSLHQKSQSLDSKLQSLQSRSHQTLEELRHRDSSIPERESAAAALIRDQTDAALSDLRKPLPANPDLSTTLKCLSRKMDSSALLRFIVSKRKESASLRAEISASISEAVDPPRLVLDAVEEFLNCKLAKSGVTDKRWACGILIQALFPESGAGAKRPEFSRRIVERAVGLVELWKRQMDEESENGTVGAAEVVMFLQMVVCFGLRSMFDDDYLRKFVMEFASRRDMAKLAAMLEFGDKMIVDLLKSCLRNYKKNAAITSKKGNNNQAATDDSTTLELNTIKAIIKCVEDHKLESEFNLDNLRKRVTQLEKTKAERKKSATAGKPKKRSIRAGGAGSSRPSKSAKFHPHPSSSSSRRNLAPSLQPSPNARFSSAFNYPSQTVYDASATANPYAATYGAAHTQSPAGMTQQHYSLPVDNLGPPGYRSSTAYVAQSSYGMYDYGNATLSTYQPPYTVDQSSYRG
ncbi:hypothetical protein AAHE18_13G184300 [Arachis hypogaea]